MSIPGCGGRRSAPGENGILARGVRFPPKIFEVRKGKSGPRGGLCRPFGSFRNCVGNSSTSSSTFGETSGGDPMAFLTGAPIRAALHWPSLPWLRNRLFTHLVGAIRRWPFTTGAADLSSISSRQFGIETGKIT